jgi:DNA-damage-inducible protein D
VSRHVQNYRRPKNIFPESFIAFLPTISIKAKDFAAEMTNVNVQQKNLYGEGQITTEHVDNNKAVRKMMINRGIVPENLPPAEDVKKVERRLASEQKKALENKNNKNKKK